MGERFKMYHMRIRWRVLFATLFAAQMFKKLHLELKAKHQKELESMIMMQKWVRMYNARRKYIQQITEIRAKKKLEAERQAQEEAEKKAAAVKKAAEEALKREMELEEKRQKELESLR